MMNVQPAVDNQPTILPSAEPISESCLGRIIASLYPESAPELTQTPSRVGQIFFAFDAKGNLVRRGVVCSESSNYFRVTTCDVFGILADTRNVRKTNTTNWRWFTSLADANAAYDEMFGLAPNPRGYWSNRELATV